LKKKASVKVTLHESQNITHEYLDANSPTEEKMPSIMDLLKAREAKESSDNDAQQVPAIMQKLNQPLHEQSHTLAGSMRTARKQPRKLAKQDSMGVDDETCSVLSDVLAYNSSDEAKHTPSLDFFAAAGVYRDYVLCLCLFEVGTCCCLQMYMFECFPLMPVSAVKAS
jgi:hypothetical protein